MLKVNNNINATPLGIISDINFKSLSVPYSKNTQTLILDLHKVLEKMESCEEKDIIDLNKILNTLDRVYIKFKIFEQDYLEACSLANTNLDLLNNINEGIRQDLSNYENIDKVFSTLSANLISLKEIKLSNDVLYIKLKNLYYYLIPRCKKIVKEEELKRVDIELQNNVKLCDLCNNLTNMVKRSEKIW